MDAAEKRQISFFLFWVMQMEFALTLYLHISYTNCDLTQLCVVGQL